MKNSTLQSILVLVFSFYLLSQHSYAQNSHNSLGYSQPSINLNSPINPGESNSIVWSNNRNCCLEYDSNNNTVVKLSGGNNWNCGIASKSYLPANKPGSIEMEIKKINHMFMIGLTEKDVNMSYEHIQYGLILQQGIGQMQLNIFENGINLGKKATVYLNDIISIERTESQSIKYLVNSNVIFTSNQPNNKCLIIDSSLRIEGAKLEDINLSENWSNNDLDRFCN